MQVLHDHSGELYNSWLRGQHTNLTQLQQFACPDGHAGEECVGLFVGLHSMPGLF